MSNRSVLVTGFNDWENLGSPPNVWTCSKNPSCRLLIGPAATAKPKSGFGGTLPRALRAHSEFTWTFLTLPTTWGAFNSIKDYDCYDATVHLGLGVYGGVHDVIQVEHGAVNLRVGQDASGTSSPGVLKGSGALKATDPISVKIAKIEGKRLGGFTIRRGNPRSSNSYICNETNFLALEAVRRSRASKSPLTEAFFLHLPYPKPDSNAGYQRLAKGVAATILELVK